MGGSNKHGELTILKKMCTASECTDKNNIAETSFIPLTSGDEGLIGETMNKYLVDA